MARRVGRKRVSDDAGSLGVDVDDDFDDGSIDGDEYTTDEDIDPTQRVDAYRCVKNLENRSRGNPAPSRRSPDGEDRPRRPDRNARRRTTHVPPSQTTKRSKRAAKSKSFLADTLARPRRSFRGNDAPPEFAMYYGVDVRSILLTTTRSPPAVRGGDP